MGLLADESARGASPVETLDSLSDASGARDLGPSGRTRGARPAWIWAALGAGGVGLLVLGLRALEGPPATAADAAPTVITATAVAKPGDAAPGDAAPADATPMDAAPGDAAPLDAAPADAVARRIPAPTPKVPDALPPPATVRLTSRPSGAQVRVGGRALGRTPIAVPVGARVTVSLPGYETAVRQAPDRRFEVRLRPAAIDP